MRTADPLILKNDVRTLCYCFNDFLYLVVRIYIIFLRKAQKKKKRMTKKIINNEEEKMKKE